MAAASLAAGKSTTTSSSETLSDNEDRKNDRRESRLVTDLATTLPADFALVVTSDDRRTCAVVDDDIEVSPTTAADADEDVAKLGGKVT